MPEPSESALADFADLLSRMTAAEDEETEREAGYQASPVHQRIDELSKALRVIAQECPALIARAQAMQHQAIREFETPLDGPPLDVLATLLRSARIVHDTLIHPSRQHSKDWHGLAFVIASQLRAVWAEVGKQQVSFREKGQPVKVVREILRHVGVRPEPSLQAIDVAVRRSRELA